MAFLEIIAVINYHKLCGLKTLVYLIALEVRSLKWVSLGYI